MKGRFAILNFSHFTFLLQMAEQTVYNHVHKDQLACMMPCACGLLLLLGKMLWQKDEQGMKFPHTLTNVQKSMVLTVQRQAATTAS